MNGRRQRPTIREIARILSSRQTERLFSRRDPNVFGCRCGIAVLKSEGGGGGAASRITRRRWESGALGEGELDSAGWSGDEGEGAYLSPASPGLQSEASSARHPSISYLSAPAAPSR
ncbi:unnamed protein product, partial [Nesidiocoris tenuis]